MTVTLGHKSCDMSDTSTGCVELLEVEGSNVVAILPDQEEQTEAPPQEGTLLRDLPPSNIKVLACTAPAKTSSGIY